MEKEQKLEEEVTELKGKIDNIEGQMSEMVKMMSALLQARGPVTSPNDNPHITVNADKAKEVQVGSSTRPIEITGAIEPVSNQPPLTHAPVKGDPVYPSWNQGGVYTYDLPGAEPMVTYPVPPRQNITVKADEVDYKDEWKEEITEVRDQLKALQGPTTWGSLELDELCLAPGVPVPKKFKVPEFTKYDGNGDPFHHLKSYCTKMSIWSDNEKFLINFFHESLTGAALNWFMRLDHSKLRKWRDLAEVFMRQYRFNLNTAPTREQLKGMKKKPNETFKEYARRWRAVASEVQPPLIESELCSYFIRTLSDPYYKIMIGTYAKEFGDLIEVGERVDADIRDGRLETGTSDGKKGFTGKKKENEVNYVQAPYQQSSTRPYNLPYQTQSSSAFQPNNSTQPTYPQPNPQNYQPNPQMSNQFPFQNPKATRPPRDDRPLPDFNVSRAELFQDLLEKRIMGPRPTRPMQPPFPAWYRPNETCEYHMGVAGHTIDRCDAFRRHVLNLLDNNHISLKAANDPNIINNPLPEHDKGKQVACIESNVGWSKNVSDIPFTMSEVFGILGSMGYSLMLEEDFPLISGGDKFCEFHRGYTDHIIEDCGSFKRLVKRMLTFGITIAGRKDTSRIEEIHAIEESLEERRRGQSNLVVNSQSPAVKRKESYLVVNQPNPASAIRREVKESFLVVNKPVQVISQKGPIAVIQTPTPFPYQSDRAVPWVYGLKIDCPSTSKAGTDSNSMAESRNDIVNVGRVTRSGRIYSRDDDKPLNRDMELGDKDHPKEGGEKNPSKDTDEEFLKIMKQSEFDIVEQLKKTPARISMLSLILSSEVHRKALQKMLNEAYVSPDITPEKVINLVDAVKNASTIAFSDEEIFSMAERPKALHITIKCYGYVIARVLIDGGSALNVLPLVTLEQLPVQTTEVERSDVIVRAFDGTRREVVGNVILPLEIGPSTFKVEFQVMDIDAAYTMLLGRPWIHAAKAVPSTLHQRVKYIEDGRLITIRGEEEMLVSKPSRVPYIENTETVVGTSFQSFETVEASSSSQGVNQVVAKMMQKSGFVSGKGLGAQLQGVKAPIIIRENPRRQGLGYQPSLEQLVDQQVRLDKGRSKAKMEVPHIKATFPTSSETIHADHAVAAIVEQKANQVQAYWIQQDHSGAPLGNWEIEMIPDVVSLE